ncbi:MAG: hypothetical protein WC608_03790 [Parcubacteria group bacterium]
MKNEQLNLYGGGMEQFKKTGKTPEDLEKEAKKDILKNKVAAFVDEKENRKAITKSTQLGGLEIYNLAKEFTRGVEDENFPEIKKILAMDLLRRKYRLSDAVMRVEIGGENLNLLKEKIKRDPEKNSDELKSALDEKKELRRKRGKLPYAHRSLPASDLE